MDSPSTSASEHRTQPRWILPLCLHYSSSGPVCVLAVYLVYWLDCVLYVAYLVCVWYTVCCIKHDRCIGSSFIPNHCIVHHTTTKSVSMQHVLTDLYCLNFFISSLFALVCRDGEWFAQSVLCDNVTQRWNCTTRG